MVALKIANKYAILGAILLAVGIMLISIAALTGKSGAAFVLFVPVIYTTAAIGVVGVFLVFVGFLLFFMHFLSIIEHAFYGELEHKKRGTAPLFSEKEGLDHAPEQQPPPFVKKRYGGVVFIGPIPIIFGSDKSMVYIMIVIGALMLLGLVFFVLLWQ